MKFKELVIDVRFSRESGRDHRGVFVIGQTYITRMVETVYAGNPRVGLITNGPEIAWLVIHDDPFSPIDGEISINSRYVYGFEFNGVVQSEYNIVRFYWDGFWYILEYRLLERRNS